VVDAANPVMSLVNEAVVPLVVKELAVVGFIEVLQQTPTALSAAPPVDVTEPPDVPVDEVIAVTVVVVASVGAEAVVKLSSFP
jgi:hypothetical protein